MKNDREIALIAHDIRSCHNVGSLFRTADAMGIKHIYISGYTPYPLLENDTRLPHLRQKITSQIHKTALGAETTVAWTRAEDLNALFDDLRWGDYQIVALEQDDKAKSLVRFKFENKVAILIGNEVTGIERAILAKVDCTVFIPMLGKKESLNVVQATAMTLYQLRFDG